MFFRRGYRLVDDFDFFCYRFFFYNGYGIMEVEGRGGVRESCILEYYRDFRR